MAAYLPIESEFLLLTPQEKQILYLIKNFNYSTINCAINRKKLHVIHEKIFRVIYKQKTMSPNPCFLKFTPV